MPIYTNLNPVKQDVVYLANQNVIVTIHHVKLIACKHM